MSTENAPSELKVGRRLVNTMNEPHKFYLASSFTSPYLLLSRFLVLGGSAKTKTLTSKLSEHLDQQYGVPDLLTARY